jgi:D-xylose transport system substrate-binding protein
VHSRFLGLVTVSAIVVALVSGCAGDPVATPTAGSGIVSLLLPDRTDSRFEMVDEPAFRTELARVCPNAPLDYQNADGDGPTQQEQLEAELAQGSRVIVIDAADGPTMGAVLADANARGVKVISYDRPITAAGSRPDYAVTFDPEQVGELQGRVLLAELQATARAGRRLIWIDGPRQDPLAQLVAKGAHRILDGAATIVQEDAPASADSSDARQLMDDAIARFGPAAFDGVYAATDAAAAGVSAAEAAAGIDPTAIPLTGQGADVAAIQRIVAGDQAMTVYEPVQAEAVAAADLACQVLMGTVTAPPATIDNGTVDVPAILLHPIAVTLDGSIPGTTSVEASVVHDAAYGSDTVSQICTAKLAAACLAAGIK